MNAEWNNGQNEEGMRSKLCQSPGGMEGMLKVQSGECRVWYTSYGRQQCRGKDLASTYVLHPR